MKSMKKVTEICKNLFKKLFKRLEIKKKENKM